MANGWHSLGAWIGDRLVGGTIYLRWGDTLYYKFNASAPDALDARPNTLLTWEGLELARSLGCRHLDLGPSDDNQPGLIRFKRQFGADGRELRFLRRVPEGWDDAPSLAPKRMLGDLTALLATLRGLPAGYSKDLQEDKAWLFDAVDTVLLTLPFRSEWDTRTLAREVLASHRRLVLPRVDRTVPQFFLFFPQDWGTPGG